MEDRKADLAIPFDGFGRMEVDLLCDDSRVVIEVDGASVDTQNRPLMDT